VSDSKGYWETQKFRVLHVDDNQLLLSQVKDILETIEPSLEVITCNDPLKAVKVLENHFFDCVVVDFMMPGMTGIELAHRIKESQEIPVVLYTGYGSEEIAEKAITMGIDEYQRKEINFDHYEALAEKIMSLARKESLYKLYHSLVESTKDPIVFLIDSKIVFHNQSFTKILESKEKLIGKKIEEFVIIEEKIKFTNWLESGENEPFTFTIQKLNSNSVKVNGFSTNLKYQGRNANLLELRKIDSTKETDQEIYDERFRSLVEVSPDGIITLNTMGFVSFVNEKFLELTGFEKDEILGKHITNIGTIRRKDILKHLRTFAQVIRGDVPKPMEFAYKRKDGTPGVGEAHLNTIRIKGKREILLIARDITHQKRREKEFTNLYEYAPDGIIQLDLEKRIIDLNKAGLELLNTQKDEIISKKFSDILDIDFDTKKRINNLINKLLKDEGFSRFEIKLSGSNKWLDAHLSLIELDGDIHGTQIIMRDITERKELEIEMEKYSKHLEEIVQERTEKVIDYEKIIAAAKVSSMIAHDLRGPLQTIKNTTYLIKRDVKNAEKYLEYIDKAVNLSNDLLEEFKNQTRQTPLKISEFNLAEIIEDVLLPVELNSNIKLIKQVEDIHIQGDSFKLKRAFQNLVKNAIEAMPKGGTLEINSVPLDNQVLVEIRDTGVGMSKTMLKNIFKPFQSTKEDGIGLGMLFIKNVIDAHKGTIDVESKEGTGSLFKIILPLTQPKENLEDTLDRDYLSPIIKNN
jgi:two-component system sporulation sensor kinase A